MEIIEKQVEKVKEVPADGCYGYGYGRRDINGKANAGLTLGIIGTALGAWALFGNRRGSGLLGLAGSGMGGSNININGLETGLGTANGITSPSAFQAWEKSCEDALALQGAIYTQALNYQNNRFADRQTLNSELFSLWKSQIDADFGLYKNRMMRYMRNSMRNSMSGEHFTESEAKYLVADMYHTENGRKYSGEKFDMHKAKEICERYRGILPTSATVADVYVAINSQYHDYAELFKNWFGDGIEQKIVESAIVFWFKDADCKAENKVVEYLGEY